MFVLMFTIAMAFFSQNKSSFTKAHCSNLLLCSRGEYGKLVKEVDELRTILGCPRKLING